MGTNNTSEKTGISDSIDCCPSILPLALTFTQRIVSPRPLNSLPAITISIISDVVIDAKRLSIFLSISTRGEHRLFADQQARSFMNSEIPAGSTPRVDTLRLRQEGPPTPRQMSP